MTEEAFRYTDADGPAEAPKVVISLLNWNGRELTANCLQSLFDTTEYPNFEVVVVDNGSTDGSVEMIEAEFPTVHLIANEENRGFAKGHNQGIEYASSIDAEYVMLLNNDAEITEADWLDRLVAVGEEETDIGVVGCTVLEPDGTVHYDGRYFPLSRFMFPRHKSRYEYNIYEESNDSESFEYVDDVVGAVFLIKREVIDSVGMLDEAYSPVYFEESDYCIRVWDGGYKVAYTDETSVVHARHGTSERMDQVYLAYVRHRNLLRFMLTNYPLTWLLVSAPFLLARTATLFIERSESGVSIRDECAEDPIRALRYAVRAYTDTVRALPDIIRKRRSRRDPKSLLK